MRASRHREALALAALIAALAAAPPAAPARTSSSPVLSLSVPASVASGARLTAAGTARRAPRDARVMLQRRKAGRWATLGRVRLARGRFRFEFKAPATRTALTLTVRVVLVRGRRRLGRSPTRRIAVRARVRIAAPVTAPPVAPPASSQSAPEVAVIASGVRMTPGATAYVVPPAPLTSITEVEPGPTGAAPGMSLRAAQGGVVVVASRQSGLGDTAPTIRGTGCTASECGRRFAMRVPVTVLPTLAPRGWSDEFDGSELDLTRWSYRATGPRFDATVTPDAVSVGDGVLTIKTYTEDGEHYVGMIGSYRHAGGGFEQTYGYLEARVRFDNASGQWSAFWLQSPTLGNPLGDPAAAGVEMDIAEHRTRCVDAPAPTPPETCSPTNDIADRIQQALIWDGYGPESKSAVKLSEPLAGLGNGSWHTWGLRWTPMDVTLYYDGLATWFQTQPISRRDEYMILSSDVGEFFAGPIPAGGYGSRDATTTQMQVDYVRVWPMADGPTPGG